MLPVTVPLYKNSRLPHCHIPLPKALPRPCCPLLWIETLEQSLISFAAKPSMGFCYFGAEADSGMVCPCPCLQSVCCSIPEELHLLLS